MTFDTITNHLKTSSFHLDKAKDALKRDDSEDDRARHYAATVAMTILRTSLDCLGHLSAAYKASELPQTEIMLLRECVRTGWAWAHCTEQVAKPQRMKDFNDALAAYVKQFPEARLLGDGK